LSFVRVNTGLSGVSSGVNHVTVASNGDVYVSSFGSGQNGQYGGIFMQTGGVGAFNSLNQPDRLIYDLASGPNGDVYAAAWASNYHIYKRSGGVGDFIAQNIPFQYGYTCIGVAPNNDFYCNDSIFLLLEIVGGIITGNETPIAIYGEARNWVGIATAPNGDVYFSCGVEGFNDPTDIFIRQGGLGSVIPLGLSVEFGSTWSKITALPNGDIYAIVNNSAMKQIWVRYGGVGAFVLLENFPNIYNIIDIAAAPNGDVYFVGTDISIGNYPELYRQAYVHPHTFHGSDSTFVNSDSLRFL